MNVDYIIIGCIIVHLITLLYLRYQMHYSELYREEKKKRQEIELELSLALDREKRMDLMLDAFNRALVKRYKEEK